MGTTMRFALHGAGGERIDFRRTVGSHGVASLPPADAAEDYSWYRTALRLDGSACGLRFVPQDDWLIVTADAKLSKAAQADANAAIRRMFRLDEDLSTLYVVAASDPSLEWIGIGAGRMLASPSVFEEVVKTVCTTNCAWSGTIRMVRALVEQLGGGAFPTPHMMAKAPESWYRDVARAGYRGAYLRELSRGVVAGLDLEALRPSSAMSDDECEARLLALPGVGPYAAAHVMLLIGRYHRLVLDSWTRPTYLRLAKKKTAKDSTIRRAFARHGNYAGLAFWLYVTREWH
jgi:3-methyladenine DNA glycosylase/8-oxoguanine DNA glycosylase